MTIAVDWDVKDQFKHIKTTGQPHYSTILGKSHEMAVVLNRRIIMRLNCY